MPSASQAAPYRNAALPAAKRVKDLLARMTLEEKAAQMMCVWQRKADTLGISAGPAHCLLVGRLWDAFFDPMMGVLADRTDTRWGKQVNPNLAAVPQLWALYKEVQGYYDNGMRVPENQRPRPVR